MARIQFQMEQLKRETQAQAEVCNSGEAGKPVAGLMELV
jgi:hypothetical protein